MEPVLKAALDDVHKAVHDFRQANDTALATKVGRAEMDEKVARINADIDAKLDAAQKRSDELERRIETDGLFRGGRGQDEEALRATLEAYAPEYGRVLSLEEFRAYKAAFPRALRRGDSIPDGDLAALKVGSNPDAGYLVPPDTSGRIVKKTFESSPIRQIAAVQTITSDALEGVTDRGEAGAGWVHETGTRSETTTPQVGKYRIEAHEMYAEPKATQKLLDDAAIDVEAWLADKTADKFARLEATAFVSGPGVGQPRGFASYTTAATADDSRTWGELEHVLSGTTGVVTADELIDLAFKPKDVYRANARWVMRRSTVAATRKLKDGQNNYLWAVSFQERLVQSLLGHPITEAEDMPAVAANALAIAFGDFMAGFQIVDRIGIRTLRDPYTSKGWVKFYTTKRVGGAVVDFDAIKFLKIKP